MACALEYPNGHYEGDYCRCTGRQHYFPAQKDFGCRFTKSYWFRGCLDFHRSGPLHDRSNEAVAPLRERLQELRLLGVVFERGPNLPDRVIQPLLKIYKGLRAPDLLDQFLPSHDFASTTDQERQNLGWLRRQSQRSSIATKITA